MANVVITPVTPPAAAANGGLQVTANNGTAWATIPDVALGSVLTSGGIGQNPVWSVSASSGRMLVSSAAGVAPVWGVKLSNATLPSLILQSGSVAESNNQSPLVIARGADATVCTTFIDSFGAFNTVVAIRCLGNLASCGSIAADGTFTAASTAGTGLSDMIDVYSDTTIGVGIHTANVGGAYALQCLSGAGTFVFSVEGNGDLQWGAGANHAAQDLVLHRDGADILAQVRGTNPQTFRVYGTTTGNKYLQFQHDGVNGFIGSAQINNLNLGALLNWTILGAGSGHLVCGTTNTYDLGTSPSSQAPRNVFAAGALCTGVKAGAAVDGDVSNPADGMIRGDSTNNKIWIRLGGTWKGVVVA